MKRMKIQIILLAGLAVGCAHRPRPQTPEQQQVADEWLVNTVRDAAVSNAIIRQHTLFPYHFDADGAALNELGRRDLSVLAEHYQQNAGELNVRRGDASEALYRSRVQQVAETLARAGVNADRVKISDGPPGGDGMPSEDVVVISSVKPLVIPSYDDTAQLNAGVSGAGAAATGAGESGAVMKGGQ